MGRGLLVSLLVAPSAPARAAATPLDPRAEFSAAQRVPTPECTGLEWRRLDSDTVRIFMLVDDVRRVLGSWPSGLLKVGTLRPGGRVKHMTFGVSRTSTPNIEVLGAPRGTQASVAIVNERNTITKCRGNAEW